MKTLRTISKIVAFGVSIVLAQERPSFVNFDHLDHLTETIQFYGDTVSIVHIYANYPDYHWIDAKESGPEGIACVDDAARAAVVYLRHYELTKNESSLTKAKSLLRFVIKMQTDDGEFYNFIFADHTINRTGKTSFKSFGWWAARGVWSMSLGYRIFSTSRLRPYGSIDPLGVVDKEYDPQFADLLKNRIALSIPHVETLMKKYGEVRTVGQLRIPQWLLYESGADVTSELLLGLTEYYRATSDERVKLLIKKLADGLMVMQDGNAATFPHGLHRSWETTWHMWGNGQTEALAYAGKICSDTAMIRSAEIEAHDFYSRLLILGFMKELDVANPGMKSEYEQIAYAIRPMAVGLLRLYEATQNVLYLKMAGLAASWFFGNNTLQQSMFDADNGICFDGITDSLTINRNSGAESTIEALHTIVELEQYPTANKYMKYRKGAVGSSVEFLYAAFHNDGGEELTLALDTTRAVVLLLEGKESIDFRKRIKEQ